MTYIPSILPSKLRRGREYRGYNQAEVANILDIHVTSYGKYENGSRQPNASQLALIANFERLDLSYYFLEEVNPHEGDFELKEIVAPLERLSQRLEAIEHRISPPEIDDPIYRSIIENLPLRRLLETVQNWDKETLQRFTDMAFAYISGKEGG